MTGRRRHAGPGEGAAQVLHADIDHRMAALGGAVVEHISLDALTTGRHWAMGSGDMLPPVPRRGSMDAAALPSRVGDRLHWPDGRVTAVGPPVATVDAPPPGLAHQLPRSTPQRGQRQPPGRRAALSPG